MQVVIDISYKLYDSIHDKLNWNGDLEQKDIKALLLAVYNGIPLPQKHGDLKDMDDIYEALEGWNEDTGWIVDAIDFQTETIVKADEGEE